MVLNFTEEAPGLKLMLSSRAIIGNVTITRANIYSINLGWWSAASCASNLRYPGFSTLLRQQNFADSFN